MRSTRCIAMNGDGFQRNRRRLFATLWWGVLAILLLPALARASAPVLVLALADQIEVDEKPRATHRDSLMVEIHRYSEMLVSMQDSLDLEKLGLELDENQKIRVKQSIDHLTRLIEQISREMGDMDLRITNNRISLLDDSGEGIIINIPENLDEQISQGFNVISQLILSELPDSVSFGDDDRFTWTGFKDRQVKRKIIQGNLVKVGDPVRIAPNEDVRGHVVVVFGDAEVSGRVDGNVVVIMGDLQLDASAEVTGEVVTVFGRLDKDPDADVGDVVVIDSLNRFDSLGLDLGSASGILNFLLSQGEFLLMLIFVALALAIAPADRVQRVLDFIDHKPGVSVLAGLGVTVVGHLVVVVLMAVLVLTVIGIPVALLLGVALLALAVLAVGLTALVLGRKLCPSGPNGCRSNWLTVLLGLVILNFVSFLGSLAGIWPELSAVAMLLTLLGVGIKVCAYSLGIGALALSRLGTQQSN